jgi:hypothetical protein
VIPQTYPLYAKVSGRAYLVIGWMPYSGSNNTYPVLVPLENTGPGHTYRGPDVQIMVSLPAPDMDATATIPAYPSVGYR